MQSLLESSSVSGFGLEPDFAFKLTALLNDCRAEGYDFRISQGLRTPQKQAEYYCKWDKHPPSDVDAKVKKLRDAGAPWIASILASYRDIARSSKWLTGALPGAGWHQWGLGADCYCYRNGKMVEDGGDDCYKFYAQRATKLGLRAGLYFTHPDAGHVQAPAAATATDVYNWAFIDWTMKERFGDKGGHALIASVTPVAMSGIEAFSGLQFESAIAVTSDFYKDDTALASSRLTPTQVYELPPGDAKLRAMARTYNAVGGLIEALATKLSIDPVAFLAVWYVESGGREFVVGEPVLRFEVHKFYKYWGKAHEADFDTHFQFGGHAGVSGKPSKNHRYRAKAGDPWLKIHIDSQDREYQVFTFAKQQANEEAACLSSSFGGPQIMGFNHDDIGYKSALDLANAFRADERWHVLGFADFCRHHGLIDAIRDHRWVAFGSGYNGDGPTYGPLLQAAFDKKAALLALPKHPNP
ncbi:N-acetylmuramidase domain-containing protein [Rhizobium leguminosarum]|uniref:N-acetylmuramidase domain-containing protein n=1 Tax=Rhizobium leguminosarum TaxID=384 RepID=UPI003F9D74AB